MGVLLAFAVGYTLGAKAGAQGFDDLVASIKAIRESEEFRNALDVLRSHASHVLREAGELVSREEPIDTSDLLARVRQMAGKIDPRQ
jgi:hypothetical protein